MNDEKVAVCMYNQGGYLFDHHVFERPLLDGWVYNIYAYIVEKSNVPNLQKLGNSFCAHKICFCYKIKCLYIKRNFINC